MSLIKLSNLACFDIRSFKNVAQSSYSLAIGKSFILTYVLTVFSMYSFICVVIFIKLIDHEFRKNVLRKLATRYFFSLTGWCQEIIHHGFLNAK